MKPALFIAAAVAFLAFVFAVPAEAARCPQGKVLYRSAGACITKAKAERVGIYRARHYTRASIRHKLRKYRAPVRRHHTQLARLHRPDASFRTPPRRPFGADERPQLERPILSPAPRPEWLVGVELFDNIHALAWDAQNTGRATIRGN